MIICWRKEFLILLIEIYIPLYIFFIFNAFCEVQKNVRQENLV